MTGPNAAGKGEVCSDLRRRGFAVHSLSDIVREEARRLGFPPEREHLIRIGNQLRRDGGPGVLAERILGRLGVRDVVDSIRNPAEVVALRRREDFVLLGVTAPPQVRFERSRSRARPGDPETFEAFVERERQENASDPSGQQLEATFGLADRVIVNEGSLDRLRGSVTAFLEAVGAGEGGA